MKKIRWLEISLNTVYSHYDMNAASLEVNVDFNSLPGVNVLYRLTVATSCFLLFALPFSLLSSFCYIRGIVSLLLCNTFVPDSLLRKMPRKRSRHPSTVGTH